MGQSTLTRLHRLGPRIAARCRALRRDTGSALAEMGMVMGFLGLPLLFGTVYFAEVLHDSIEVANAAHAGAVYGMRSATYASNTSGITSAAQAETSDLSSTLSVTPTVFYACSSAIGGTQYTTVSAANTACTGTGNHALEFVQVVASTTITPAGRVTGLAKTFTLSSTSIMEVEE